MMILQELMNLFKVKGKTLIPTDYISNWISLYRGKEALLDEYFTYVEKNRIIDFYTNDENLLLAYADNRVMGCLLDNDYKYNTLYRTIIQEYNPIHNYNSESEVTTTYGELKSKSNNGQMVSTNTNIDSTTTYLSNVENEKQKSENTTNVMPHENTVITDTHIDTIKTITKGNIGVTTTAQMLKGERELADFRFLSIVFNDIINSLCTSLYEEV